MKEFPVVASITMVVIFVAFLFAFYLFTVKTEKKLSNILIGAFFIVYALHISNFVYRDFYEVPSILGKLREHVAMLSRPILFLYVLSAIYVDFKLKWKHAWHLLPFLLIIMVFIPGFYLTSEAERIQFDRIFYGNWETKFNYIFAYLVNFFYIILIFVELHKYKKILLENHSFTDTFNYKWLFQMTIILCIFLILGLVMNIYKYLYGNIMVVNTFYIIIVLYLLLFLSWIILKGMYYPELFRGINSKLRLVENIITESALDTKVNDVLNDSIIKQISSLKTYMTEVQPYLNSSLTLKDLSTQMNLTSRELSILINHHLNQRFFDFVNSYRIQKTVEILKNPMNDKRTISEILYEVGFNSKSSFNTAFKKFTQMTPTKYRKGIKENRSIEHE